MASASDNFDRADGPIGANWTVDNGSINIVSNVAEPQTAVDMNRARYTATAMDTSNHYSQALIGRGAAGSNQGAVTVRQASATWTHYSANKVNNNSDCFLRKTVAGVETTLATYLATAGIRTLRCTANGSTISMDVDGTERASVTDTAIAVGTFIGMEVYNNTNGRWDNWLGADLSTISQTLMGQACL